MQSNPWHHQEATWLLLLLIFWDSQQSAVTPSQSPVGQGGDERPAERDEEGLGGGGCQHRGGLTHGVPQVPGAGRRGGQGAGGKAAGSLRASSRREDSSTRRRLGGCSCGRSGTWPAHRGVPPQGGPSLPSWALLQAPGGLLSEESWCSGCALLEDSALCPHREQPWAAWWG